MEDVNLLPEQRGTLSPNNIREWASRFEKDRMYHRQFLGDFYTKKSDPVMADALAPSANANLVEICRYQIKYQNQVDNRQASQRDKMTSQHILDAFLLDMYPKTTSQEEYKEADDPEDVTNLLRGIEQNVTDPNNACGEVYIPNDIGTNTTSMSQPEEDLQDLPSKEHGHTRQALVRINEFYNPNRFRNQSIHIESKTTSAIRKATRQNFV